MQSTPSPKGPKVCTSRPLSNEWPGGKRKLRPLVHELENLWNTAVPEKDRPPILFGVLSDMVEDLSEFLPSTLYRELQLTIESRDFKRLLEIGAANSPPQMHADSRGYFASVAVLNLLKKFPFEGVEGLDPLKTAMDRFYDAEKYCKLTNRRFSHYSKFDFASRPVVKRLRLHEVFHLARRKIAEWMGELDMDEILDHARFGPGGVVGLKRPFTTAYHKLRFKSLTVSEGAYWYAIKDVTSCNAWMRSLYYNEGLIQHPEDSVSCVPLSTAVKLVDSRISIANYNEVTFVPKDAKTHRAIAIEPHLNVRLQLGVGTYLKKRLRQFGCDLTDQTRNQHLAYVGSIQHDRDDPVTLDLSMASDCLATSLVKELIPGDWFNLLDNLRSREGKLRGSMFKWNKFSSMGNGYTFELESMIFYALAQSVSDVLGVSDDFQSTFGRQYRYAYVSVFGDDIIVPKNVAPLLIQVLRFCGFRTNEEKSFTEGPFRESCGKDYFDGQGVRPFFLKRGLTKHADLIHLHNGLKDLESRLGLSLGKALTRVRALIPKALERHLRNSEPTIGDTHLWVTPDEVHLSKLALWSMDYQSWMLPQMVQRPRIFNGSLNWRLCQFLYNTTRRPAIDSSSERFATPGGGGDPGAVGLSGDVDAKVTWTSSLGDQKTS